MTRPIFEPSLPRTDRKLGFGADQLFRRPAPTSSGGPVVYRAEQWSIDTTVVNNTATGVLFDEWSNPDTSIFVDDLDGTLTKLEAVQLLVPGYVVIKLAWQWATSWQTDALLESQGGFIDDNINVWQKEGQEFLRVVLTGEDYTIAFSEVYPTIAWEEGHGGNELPIFSAWLSQKTGANKNAQARMTIAYWPATIGTIGS